MAGRIELLEHELDEAFLLIRQRVEGLSDEEFFWQPVADCWTVHPDALGRWIGDYEEPDPVPAPFTTIAWRLTHVATCKLMYHEYAFGPRAMTWDDIEIPHTFTEAIAMLERGQRLLESDLRSLADEDLDAPRLTNWGEPWPTWQILWTIVAHDLAHGAEIGVVRDLYRQIAQGSHPG
jgi:hypothetical protein